ncbi:MAG: hypothetical protein P4L33_05620 [Capsulimonadaceae bacterium]|nr:hypothetical protein [Capsulimonadaceae bacterium]
MAKEDLETISLSLKEAHSLLAAARFASIAPLLKDPEFAMLTALSFAGFRVDSNGYANPMVRRRLAEEATRNPLFAAKLREIAAQAQQAPPPLRLPPVHRDQPPDSPRNLEAAEDRARQPYRIERDRLKKERDEEVERRRAAEAELAQARIEALAAGVAKADALRDLEAIDRKVDRLERKLRRAEVTNAELRKLVATQASLPNRQTSGENETVSRSASEDHSDTANNEAAFIDAVRRLVEKPNNSIGRQIASEVLRHSPENVDALEIQADAAQKAGDAKASAVARRSLLTIQVRAGSYEPAARTLSKLFEVAPDPRAAHEYFAALAQAGIDPPEIRPAFDHVRASNPALHRQISEHAQGDLKAALFHEPERGAARAEEALPLRLPPDLGRTASGRAIVAWLDGHDAKAFHALRKALASTSDADRKRVAEAIEAASGDDSYYRLLTRKSIAGPVLVDASNVAWHGQEMLSNPKPRMSHILAVRRALRLRGHFPIYMIADANLPHVVDDPQTARRMIADGEISLAISGTDADEHLLREAKRLGGYVVTNDYMADWDPAQEVPKLQYSIAHTTGVASIYEA